MLQKLGGKQELPRFPTELKLVIQSCNYDFLLKDFFVITHDGCWKLIGQRFLLFQFL